jgi:hypothetical protein
MLTVRPRPVVLHKLAHTRHSAELPWQRTGSCEGCVDNGNLSLRGDG